MSCIFLSCIFMSCIFSAPTSSCSSHQSAVASSLQRALKPEMHILNKVFDSNIALLASFVTAVDYSSSYEPTGLSFLYFLSIWLLLSNNTQKRSVSQGRMAAKVDCQCTNSCNYFFQSFLPKITIICLNLLKLLYRTLVSRIQ